MHSSVLNDDGLHHQLIPHREQSATYGIPSSSSGHPPPFLSDKFPPTIDPFDYWHHLPALPPPPQLDQMAISFPFHPLPTYVYEAQDESAPPGVREKKHCCLLCNKRFDRPSTLKKHMLVHTGEKAWACEICGRRFSVSSNLNRHTRRCREKWAKADSSAADTPSSSVSSEPSEHTEPSPPSSTSSDSPDPHRPLSPRLADRPKRRQSPPDTLKYESGDGTPRPHDQQHVAGKPHRRRRKSSPAERWIPSSLVNFNLNPTTGTVTTPLPAVIPSSCEERNSFDDTPLQAYHPSSWTGRLVGPSHAPKSEEISRGRFYGKLLVF